MYMVVRIVSYIHAIDVYSSFQLRSASQGLVSPSTSHYTYECLLSYAITLNYLMCIRRFKYINRCYDYSLIRLHFLS